MKNIRKKGSAGFRGSVAGLFRQRLGMVCLAVCLAGGPVSTALADGFTTIQYEFALGKRLQLRQINLAFQQEAGRVAVFELGRDSPTGIAIPLYSTNPAAPGLLNRLNAAEAEGGDEPKADAGTVVLGVLGAGVLGLILYAVAKCIDEATTIDLYEPEEKEKNC